MKAWARRPSQPLPTGSSPISLPADIPPDTYTLVVHFSAPICPNLSDLLQKSNGTRPQREWLESTSVIVNFFS